MRERLADVPHVDQGPWVTEFGRESYGWDVYADQEEEDGDGTGFPGRGLVMTALRIFGDCHGDLDAATAARVFNLPLSLIEDAMPVGGVGEADPEDVPIADLDDLVQAISGCRTCWGTISVAEVAKLANQRPARIVEAVGHHPWMYLTGDYDDFGRLFIEHDGE